MTFDFDRLAARIAGMLPAHVDYASARLVRTQAETLSVRDGVVEPPGTMCDLGVMVTVYHQGGMGYSATADLSDSGIQTAIDEAARWAKLTARACLVTPSALGHATGSYNSDVTRSWADTSLPDLLSLLHAQDQAMAIDDRIVDRGASVTSVVVDSALVTNQGGHIVQRTETLYPGMYAVANQGVNTQVRTFGAGAYCGQGGLEVLERHGFNTAAGRIADEALQLLGAPMCPDGVMDVVLAPDQMHLQIHESIGHPLELDRILGDERNYAGTSFVTLDMLGAYQYGSSLLNVVFDPHVFGQTASYAFDDDGTPAARTQLIENGVLVGVLGGALSRDRAGISGSAGMANSRACGWNRPPIDRMGNVNVEPGDSTFDELVAGVERGVFMATNSSWSIDDRRDKFQFGCEWGQLIVDGELGAVVRNPNYRGRSADFWRSLTGVGSAAETLVLGVDNCGKGEPNQSITVGHATPPCRFANVSVFGGDNSNEEDSAVEAPGIDDAASTNGEPA